MLRSSSLKCEDTEQGIEQQNIVHAVVQASSRNTLPVADVQKVDTSHAESDHAPALQSHPYETTLSPQSHRGLSYQHTPPTPNTQVFRVSGRMPTFPQFTHYEGPPAFYPSNTGSFDHLQIIFTPF